MNSNTLSHWEKKLSSYKYSSQKININDNNQIQDTMKSNDILMQNKIISSKNISSLNSCSDSISKISSSDNKANDLNTANKNSEETFDIAKETDNAAYNILKFNKVVQKENSKVEVIQARNLLLLKIK
jgi:hypothetical protein